MSIMRRGFAATRIASVVCAWTVLANACTNSGTASPPKRSVQIRIDSMTVHGVAPLDLGILIYGDSRASVQFGTQPPHLLVDTVRLRSTPSFTLDVSAGSVHVEFVDGQLDGGGVMLLSGHVAGTDSIRFRAVGRHLLAEQGGTGIRVIDRGNPKLMR